MVGQDLISLFDCAVDAFKLLAEDYEVFGRVEIAVFPVDFSNIVVLKISSEYFKGHPIITKSESQPDGVVTLHLDNGDCFDYRIYGSGVIGERFDEFG